MFAEMPIRKSCDVSRVLGLCGMLIADGRGKTLGEEIQAQVGSGYIKGATYARLSRWVHPKTGEPNAQAVAQNLSCELFGFVISRVEDRTTIGARLFVSHRACDSCADEKPRSW